MTLSELLEGYIGDTIPIEGIASDSRLVKPGYLFVALPSVTGKDICDFVKQALSKGATAVIARPDICQVFDAYPVTFIASDNPRQSLAMIASKFYKKKPPVLAAVTGTNGKTSVAEFTRQFWQQASHPAATIGTLGILGQKAALLQPGSQASPDTIQLHEMMEMLAQSGYTHVIMEASSHGLDQYRLDSLSFQVGAFTNLTQDHLDYHGTMEDYFQAKTLLFTRVLPEGATAVLNADISDYSGLKALCEKRKQTVLSYGIKGETLKILSCKPLPRGQKVSLQLAGATYDMIFPLIGKFQLMNALCAAGIGLATGISPLDVIKTLQSLTSVPGRIQHVGETKQGAHIYVDYAHTPDGLENALKTIRDHTTGNLWAIFGAGGDRDRLKRPLMGQVAAQFADRIIVTDDNPRHESPEEIRAEVMKGCPDAHEIGDREEAIRIAIKSLEAGDILVVAGKGHEQTQIIGDDSLPFSDGDVVKKVLKEGY